MLVKSILIRLENSNSLS